jgi:hypothetical protein
MSERKFKKVTIPTADELFKPKKLIKMATANLKYENEKEQIDYKMDDLLRKKGWSQSSSHPGCIWLWSKDIKGKTYVVNKATAIHMQSWADEYGED